MPKNTVGPTRITVQDDHLHIEGYPDAERVVKLMTPKAKRLADMRLHECDLGFCERALQTLGTTLSGGPPSDLSQAIWISVLTKFYSCFGGSASRSDLDPKKVYAGNPDALKAFLFYRNVRNKNVVHDENNYNYSATGIVLGARHEVQDILSLQLQARSDNLESGV